MREMVKTVESAVGDFKNPIKVESFKQLEKVPLDKWVKINGRKELKTAPEFFLLKHRCREDRQYTISIEVESGIQLAVFSHYISLPDFEKINPLIIPFIKETYRIGTGITGQSIIFGKLKNLGYKENA